MEGEEIKKELKFILGNAAYNDSADFATVLKMAKAIRYLSTQLSQMKRFFVEKNELDEAKEYVEAVRTATVNILVQ